MKVPVHLVLGPPASGKSALIDRLLEARQNWIGFANHRASANPRLHALPRGCPCCTARVEMQVLLARTLRKIRAGRVLIEILHEAHHEAAARALGTRPLASYLSLGAGISLPRDRALLPEDLELERGGLTAPGLAARTEQADDDLGGVGRVLLDAGEQPPG